MQVASQTRERPDSQGTHGHPIWPLAIRPQKTRGLQPRGDPSSYERVVYGGIEGGLKLILKFLLVHMYRTSKV